MSLSVYDFYGGESRRSKPDLIVSEFLLHSEVVTSSYFFWKTINFCHTAVLNH